MYLLDMYLKNIHGIQLNFPGNTKEIKCTQYADDTCVFLSNLNDVERCLNEIQIFSGVSGLNLNLEKTEGLCIGSLKDSYPVVQVIKWPIIPIRYLGVYIGNNEQECQNLNWESKLEKIQKLLNSWRRRNLSLCGKVTIIKTLVLLNSFILLLYYQHQMV